jgi:two-component system NtrC family sensor kinase
MGKFLKDRYFWYIVIIAVPVVIFTYAADIIELTGVTSIKSLELVSYYSGLQRLFFIVAIAIVAWKYGIKWGLAICLILGPVILSHYIIGPRNPDIFLQAGVVLIGVLSSWLIGRQGMLKRLLEESSEELRLQAEKLNLEITERGRIEETLRESEKRYRLLAENATDVIWTVDVNNPTQLTYISPSVNRLLGYSVEEAITKKMEEIFTPASFNVALETLAEEQISSRTEPSRARTLEVELIRKDGSTVPVEINGSFIHDNQGQPVDILIIARDISERKQMEEQLIMTDRLASIGELTSGIAHELNNPLTSIIGFSELLIDEDIPENIKSQLDIMYNEAQRAAEITKNLLTFARNHSPVKQASQINNIIEDVLRLRSYEQKIKNIEVNTQLDADLPEIMVDYFQMQQVFLNIIINAEFAMLEAHNRGTLTITTQRVNNHIKASFTDDGNGILKENLSQIFNPFFSTKDVGKGTGLGLSICHGIVTEHGGSIYARSEPVKGATFIVELPVNSN